MLIIISLGDPLSSEGAEGGEGRCTLPDGELTVGRCDDLDLGTSWGKINNFILKSVGETLVHGSSTGEDKVRAEGLSDINIRFLNGVPGEGMDGLDFLSVELWVEEELWALHSDLSWNGDDLLVWEGECFVGLSGLLCLGGLFAEVGSDIAAVLLNVLNDFFLGGGCEVDVDSFLEELLKILGQSAASDVHLLNGVRN